LEQVLGRILLLNIAIYLSNIKFANFLRKKYAHKFCNSQKIIVTDTIKNAKKWSFSRLFSGFHFWTFLKMSKIHFPFDFMGKSCDCDGEAKKTDIFLTFYGKRKSKI
jgi:hypothetical protein